MRSIIDIQDLTIEEIQALIMTACDIIRDPNKYSSACRGKKLATLFFEPSTRTRLSFEAAMYELGAMSSQCRAVLRRPPQKEKAWPIPQG